MIAKQERQAIALLISLLSLISIKEAQAATPSAKSSAAKTTAAPAAPAAQPFTVQSLQDKARAYRAENSETAWQAFSTTFKTFLSDPRTARLTAKQIMQSNPSLTDLHVQVIDAHGIKLWTFPGIKENRVIFAQKIGAMPAPESPGIAVEILEYPADINLTDARVVHSSTTTTTVGPRGKKHTQVVEGPRFLTIAGYKRSDGQLFLKAYKVAGSVLAPTNEPFQHVPASLMQGGATRAYFSGNQLIIGMPSTEQANKTDGHPLPSGPMSSSYQVVLKFEGNAFTLAEKPSAEGPLPIAVFFVKTLLEGRTDVAKAWVGDPALMNIPKYLGLIGKNPSRPYKLVAMSVIPGAPIMARYRLVTYEAQDLIIDIGKVKKDTKVKGIFVAPCDPVARNLNGALVGGQLPAAETPVPSGGAGGGGESGSSSGPAVKTNGNATQVH